MDSTGPLADLLRQWKAICSDLTGRKDALIGQTVDFMSSKEFSPGDVLNISFSGGGENLMPLSLSTSSLGDRGMTSGYSIEKNGTSREKSRKLGETLVRKLVEMLEGLSSLSLEVDVQLQSFEERMEALSRLSLSYTREIEAYKSSRDEYRSQLSEAESRHAAALTDMENYKTYYYSLTEELSRVKQEADGYVKTIEKLRSAITQTGEEYDKAITRGNDLQAKLQASVTAHDALKVAYEKVKSDTKAFEAKLEDMLTKIVNERESKNQYSSKYEGLRVERDQAVFNLADAREARLKAEQLAEILKTEVREKSLTINKLEADLSHLRSEHRESKIGVDRESARGSSKRDGSRLVNLTGPTILPEDMFTWSDSNSQTQSNANLQAQSKETNQQAQAREAHSNSQQLMSLQNQLQHASSELVDTRNRLNEVSADYAKCVKELELVRTREGGWNTEHETLRRSVDELSTALGHKNKETADLAHKLSRVNAEKQSLSTEVDRLSGINAQQSQRITALTKELEKTMRLYEQEAEFRKRLESSHQ